MAEALNHLAQPYKQVLCSSALVASFSFYPFLKMNA